MLPDLMILYKSLVTDGVILNPQLLEPCDKARLLLHKVFLAAEKSLNTPKPLNTPKHSNNRRETRTVQPSPRPFLLTLMIIRLIYKFYKLNLSFLNCWGNT